MPGPIRTVSRNDAACLRELVAAGCTPEEAAAEFSQYEPKAAAAAAGRLHVPNDVRDRVFWAILGEQYFQDIAAELGLTLKQVQWVEYFYLPAEVRVQVLLMTRAGVPVQAMFDKLAAQERIITMISLEIAVRHARWAQMRRDRKAGVLFGGRAHRPNRQQRALADPAATFRPPDHTNDKAPDFCSYEEYLVIRNRRRAISAGAACK